MGDCLMMSGKERKRKVILEEVCRHFSSLRDATHHLGVCYRQAKRLLSKYRRQGDVGLVHGNRGKASNRAKPAAFKAHVLELYREKYLGFGPTFSAEKLSEWDHVQVHPEVLRKWLLKEGLWHRHRKRKKFRQRRARREAFGELVQIDGSEHAWFGGDHPRACLLNMVDDATTTTLSEMDTGETCRVLLSTFKKWVKAYGVPKSVYVDLKSIYVSPKKQVYSKDDKETKSVFERVCKLLDVKIIKAYSAQAKGRVERNHAVYQDRFVKELKLRGIQTIKEANAFLQKSYLSAINKKFAKPSKQLKDAHVSALAYGDLDQIFCWEYTRTIRNDFTIRFNNDFFQLKKVQGIPLQAKQRGYVRVHLNNSISLWKGKHRLRYEKLAEAPKKEVREKKEYSSSLRSEIARKNRWKSPWNRVSEGWLKY